MQKNARIASLLLALVVFAGCGSGGGFNLISEDEEWQLGQQMAAQVAQQVRLADDSYLTEMGERIHRATPLANRPFTFHVVQDANVNAFSLPGGHIYINSGLIGTADRANELAAVVAHEISHVVARHATKQMSQAQGINVLGSILLGQNASQLSQVVAQIVAGGAMARFSRADEKEADDLGLEFMARAGYNPNGMLTFFQKLLAMENGSGSSSVSRFFADHPGTTDRIKDVSGRLAKMNTSSGITDEAGFRSLRSRYGR
jgi:predicted Zn-dependent protease